MKKKICIFLVVLLLLCNVVVGYCSLASWGIKKMATAAAIPSSTSIAVPGFISGLTSAGSAVATWAPLVLPGTVIGSLVASIIVVGGSMAIDYLTANDSGGWFHNNGIECTGGTCTKTTSTPVPDGHTSSDYTYPLDGSGNIGGGIYATQSAAGAAQVAARNSQCLGSMGHTGCPGDRGAKFYWVMNNCSGPSYGKITRFYYGTCSTAHAEDVKTDISAFDVGTMVGNAVAGGDGSVGGLGMAAVKVAGDSLENPSHPVNQNPVAKQGIQDALKSAVNPDDLVTAESQATTLPEATAAPETPADYSKLTPAQIAAAVQAALSAQGLSATQIAAAIAAIQQAAAAGLTQAQAQAAVSAALTAAGVTSAGIQSATKAAIDAAGINAVGVRNAVKAAIDDETGVSNPSEPTITNPVKKSLTAIMNTFLQSLNGLPMLQTLRGITVNCSGSSSLCLDLPENYGGSRCWDAAPIQGSLNAIGTALLSITSIIMFIYIFRS